MAVSLAGASRFATLCRWVVCFAITCLSLRPALAQAPVNPLAAADPFLGVFSDDTMTLTLERDGGGYQGVIEFQGKKFALAAEREGDRLSGEFDAEGTAFPFEALRQGDALRFETAGTVYNLTRRAVASSSANPLARQTSAPAASETPAPGTVASERYQSTAGYSLALPRGWRAQEDGSSNVGLVPPNQGQELYLVSPLDGVTDPSDQTIAVYLQNMFIHQNSQPSATHQTNTVNVGGVPVVVRDWQFPHPQTRAPMRLSAYLVAAQGHVFAVLGTGQPEQLGSRQADLLNVAGSLQYGGNTQAAQTGAPMQNAPQAAMPQQGVAPAQGVQTHPQAPPTPGKLSDGHPQSEQWLNHLRGKLLSQLESYSSGTAGGYSSNERMLLYPDGRFEYYSSSLVSVSVDNAGASSGGQGTQRGTWRIVTANGATFLALVFERATEERYARLDFNDNKTFLDGRRTFVTVPE